MATPAINVEGLWKEYVVGAAQQRHDTFYDLLTHSIRAPFNRWRKLAGKAEEERRFWALRDVNFTVPAGEVLGIIGRNGAGKSTLLKVLSRITAPTRGRVTVRGRMASLLEVGTGFHGELSGRENIYLNGAILGMTRADITRKFDAIVEFAEIGKFIDTPVKRYSSGMYVRLAFSVAAHLEPDILVIDEVLAVGDAAFQKRCLGKMQDVAHGGRTVIFVSHNMGAVSQMCSRAILLENGRCVLDAPVSETIGQYLVGFTDAKAAMNFPTEPGKDIQIASVSVVSDDDAVIGSCTHKTSFAIRLEYLVNRWPSGCYICVEIFNEHDTRIIWSSDVESVEEMMLARQPGTYRSRVGVPAYLLAPGRYYFTVAAYAPGRSTLYDLREKVVSIEIADGGTLLSNFGVQSHAVTMIPLVWETRLLSNNGNRGPAE